MESNYFLGGFYKFSVIFARLAYLNLLWGLFIFLGLGIFGFFPSTIAMFTLIRKWIKGDEDPPIFNTFWQTYKREFFKSNLIGVVYALSGIVLFIDILYFSQPETIVTLIFYYFFLIISFIFIIFGFFLFPVYVHYKNSWWGYFKSTLKIMLMNPLTVLAFSLILAGFITLFNILPGLIPFFSGSGIAYALMLVCFHAFNKVKDTPDQNKMETSQVLRT